LRYCVLSHCLNISPSNIRIEYSDSGRPNVISPFPEQRLFFSQTHTDAYVLLAVSDAPCGVDAEKLRSPSSYPYLCRRGLPETWIEELSKHTMDSPDQCVLFVRYWTALESLYKLCGGSSLRRFLAGLKQDKDTGDFCAETRVKGIHFKVGADHTACLTVCNSPGDIFYYRVNVPLLPFNYGYDVVDKQRLL